MHIRTEIDNNYTSVIPVANVDSSYALVVLLWFMIMFLY